jgi:hypothetical protein
MSHHPVPSRRQLLRGAIALGALAPGSLAPAQTAASTESLPETVLYYGTTAPLPRQITLTAGPLSLTFEPELALLRHLRFGEREVLRGIYAAVRDRSWLTVAPSVTNVVTRTSGDSFELTFDVACKQDDIDYFWKGRITGSSAGSVRFEFDGLARSSFMRNRIGFCVLHPIAECAAQPCAIESADGSKQQGRFPDLISPNQPFVNMRAISHEVAPGVTAEVRFEGDIFEMEDQRNWTDASYKTYCTPLGLPYPAKVEKGARVRQAVTLTLAVQGNARRARTERRPEVTLEAGPRGGKLPKIGVGWGPDQPPLSRTEVLRLRAAGLSHLRVDLDLTNPDFAQRLEQAAGAGLPLEIAAFVTNQAERELTALAAACARVKPRIARWLVFHKDEITTGPERVRLARKTLGALSHTPFGAGTNQYFTELNRNRPSIEAMDAVCYSANPQVHAFDNLSLVEALAGQAYTVTSARSFCGSRPVAVTPITLRPRFNPQAAAPETSRSGALPSRIDARQMSLFAAGWTLGSIKYLAESGADSATYYETTGWGGIMERAAGSPLPNLFRSFPGGAFPLYHVLADVGEFGPGAEARVIHSSDPLSVDGCLLRLGNRARLLLANFSPRVQYVRVVKPELGRAVRVRRLNERTAIRAMKSPEEFRKDPGSLMTFPGADFEMALLPFEVARVDAA